MDGRPDLSAQVSAAVGEPGKRQLYRDCLYGFSAPAGDDGNSAGHGFFTPTTIAAGEGFGDFNVQSTLGITFPSGDDDRLGWPVVWNTAFQYHIFKYFWPEVETNYTWFAKGERTGQN